MQFRIAHREIGPFLTLAGTTCWPFLSIHHTLARNPSSPLRGSTYNAGMPLGAVYSNEISARSSKASILTTT